LQKFGNLNQFGHMLLTVVASVALKQQLCYTEALLSQREHQAPKERMGKMLIGLKMKFSQWAPNRASWRSRLNLSAKPRFMLQSDA
jgi:hypothetical protein